jgi:hypothetical protein
VKHHQQHARLAFDEQRALEDLQRLHREIQRARGQRQRAESEFDAFTGAFESGTGSIPESAAKVDRPLVRSEETGPRDRRQTVSILSNLDMEETPAQLEPPSRERPWTRRPLVVGPIVAVAIVAGVMAVRARRTPPEATSAPAGVSAEQNTAAAAAGRQGSAPANTQPSPPVVATPSAGTANSRINLELLTHRTVWLRVTVDGRRTIEREAPAGQRIPVLGDRAIVIRAGDAGAITLSVNGRDQGPLGQDGAILTRTFTAEPR